ncbi:MAG: N-acetylglucosamine kinase [Candidatus Acidiferrales bacterium]
MKSFLGFDAGGTKTHCVALDDAGQLLAETTGGAANPLRIGLAKACAALEETARRALAEARENAGDVRAICAGVAGAGRPRIARRLSAHLARAFPQSSVRVTTDIEVALDAAIGPSDIHGQGIVIVAGTGSAACGRNSAGQIARAGGWGPWIGDPGSAYDIGRRAVEAALRARDHLGGPTVLGGKLLHGAEALSKAEGWDALLERIAKHPDAVFPKLFPVVAEAAAADDAVSQEILAAAAKSLAMLAKAVMDSLALAGQSFTLAKSGGVFGHSPHLDAALDQELLRIAPAARIEPLRVSPARAAAELARRSIANISADEA